MSETKKLEICTQIDFNKDDVAIIAIAEAEKKIRQTIAKLSIELENKKEQLNKLNDDVVNEGENFIRNKFLKKLQTINTNLKKTGIPKLEAVVDYIPQIPSLTQLDNKVRIKNANKYIVKLVIFSKDNETRIYNMEIESGCVALTKTQKNILTKTKAVDDNIKALKPQILDYRRKLSDIPTLERQIKAKLAAGHLSKTKEGRQVIESLVKNFDETIKLLGM